MTMPTPPPSGSTVDTGIEVVPTPTRGSALVVHRLAVVLVRLLVDRDGTDVAPAENDRETRGEETCEEQTTHVFDLLREPVSLAYLERVPSSINKLFLTHQHD
jgi:hypothetical protein